MGADELFSDREKPPSVPMNSDQVWMFDAVRALNGRDRGTLVVWWLVGLMFIAVGVVGANAVVIGLGALFVATALWWTVSRLRSSREDAAIQRYADSRPVDPD
jgi:Flp pilus assembly protein TadB